MAEAGEPYDIGPGAPNHVERVESGLLSCGGDNTLTIDDSGSSVGDTAVVVTDSSPPSPPCGLCRETLTEFAGPDLPVLLATSGENGDRVEYRLGELLPHPFEFPPR